MTKNFNMKPQTQHQIFMEKALRLAINNVRNGHGGPFGAVIVKDGKIVATGVNSVALIKNPTAHAEILAIQKACKKLNTFILSDCEIYSSCEPCPMCLGAIYWARIKRLYYMNTKKQAAAIGFADQFIYNDLKKSAPKRKLATERVIIEEPLKAFEEWELKTDKIPY